MPRRRNLAWHVHSGHYDEEVGDTDFRGHICKQSRACETHPGNIPIRAAGQGTKDNPHAVHHHAAHCNRRPHSVMPIRHYSIRNTYFEISFDPALNSHACCPYPFSEPSAFLCWSKASHSRFYPAPAPRNRSAIPLKSICTEVSHANDALDEQSALLDPFPLKR